MIAKLSIPVNRKGLHNITAYVLAVVEGRAVKEGLCTLYIQHTSASLLIQEGYDSSARIDLEHWLDRLVPENDPLYTHDLEGPEDMPAHIKAALTATSVSIPIMDKTLALGTWQGIYLWEHRNIPGERSLVIHIGG